MPSKRKLAVVITSFSTLIEKDLEKYNDIFLIPLQLFIDDRQWLEGFYSKSEKYKVVELFKNANQFSTSTTPALMIEEQMEKLAKNYDEVIYLPINSYLSSQHDHILNTSKKYKNVHVFDNRFNGYTYVDAALEIKRRYEEKNESIKEIFDFLEWYNNLAFGFIIPYNLKTFIKSGRLKGLKKALMVTLKFSIIVEVDDIIKSIGVASTKKLAANKVMNRFEQILKQNKMTIDDFNITSMYAYDKEIIDIMKNQLKVKFNREVDFETEASIVTMMHTGFGAGYIGFNPKISLYQSQKTKKIKKF